MVGAWPPHACCWLWVAAAPSTHARSLQALLSLTPLPPRSSSARTRAPAAGGGWRGGAPPAPRCRPARVRRTGPRRAGRARRRSGGRWAPAACTPRPKRTPAAGCAWSARPLPGAPPAALSPSQARPGCRAAPRLLAAAPGARPPPDARPDHAHVWTPRGRLAACPEAALVPGCSTHVLRDLHVSCMWYDMCKGVLDRPCAAGVTTAARRAARRPLRTWARSAAARRTRPRPRGTR